VTTQTPRIEDLDDPVLPDERESIERASRLVSSRTGIVSSLDVNELEPDDPALHWVTASPADAQAAGLRRTLSDGNAVSIDPLRAAMKAVGESVERYCSAQWRDEDLTITSRQQLTGYVAEPSSFALFSPEQYAQSNFPWHELTNDAIVPWVTGTSFVSGHAVAVPAAFVYVPFGPAPNDSPIFASISTGLACGPSLAHAAYRAVVEVVERDAFMIVWRNKLVCERIDLPRVEDSTVRRLIAAYDGLPTTLHAVVLTLDIAVSVVLCLLESTGSPLRVIGLGADLSPLRALQLSLEEASLSFIGMRRLVQQNPNWRPSTDRSDLTDISAHGLAHAIDDSLLGSTDFLRQGAVVAIEDFPNYSQPSPKQNLVFVVNEVAKLGYDVVAMDLTTDDVDDVGFKVVRVVVPGLQPLDTSHIHQYLGGRRMYEVPIVLGLRVGPISTADLNSQPHPFP
jgi:ribosomal protein S12 methylthiotransferase accessory factor